MPCICQYFNKDKNITSASESSLNCSFSNSAVKKISTSEVCASELASLKAEVWTLKSNLSENKSSIEYLQNTVKNLAEEKYQLLNELVTIKEHFHVAKSQFNKERDISSIEKKELLNDMFALKNNLDEKQKLLEEIAKQNINLKLSLQEAHETIERMANMYLNLKQYQKDPSSEWT